MKHTNKSLRLWELWGAHGFAADQTTPHQGTAVTGAAEQKAAGTIHEIYCALRMLLVLTVVTGVVYPVMVTAIAQVAFRQQANGSLVHLGDKLVGSALLAQSFTNDTHFWPRPSAAGFATVPSGASNNGPTAGDLKTTVTARALAFRAAHGLAPDARVPSDMLFASGSGLDPHISLRNAELQSPRVARARGVSVEQVMKLVRANTDALDFGVLGEPGVNVLRLNLALDQ